MVVEPAPARPTDPGSPSPGAVGAPRPLPPSGPDVLSRVAAQALEAPAACVWLLDPDDPACLGAHVSDGVDRARFVRAARSWGERVVATGGGVFVDDLASSPELPGVVAASESGLAAVAACPVRAPDGAVVGGICVADVRRRPWTAEQRAMLDDLASLAGAEVRARSAELDGAVVRARLAQYERAVEQASEVLWCLRVLPGRRMELVYHSPNLSRLIDPSLVSGPLDADGFSAFITEDDAPGIRQFLDGVLAGEPAETEVRMLDADGRVRWVWARARPRRQDGELFGDGVTSEITERKQVEEMRTQFLAIAGHELRTPLSVIRGYAEMISSQVAELPEVRRQVAAIERRAGEMEVLVGDFFDLAKLQSESVELVRSEVSVDVLVTQAVADHALVAAEAGVVLVPSCEPLALLADPVRLRQVLDNLVSNAIRHTPRGGEVRVTCVRLREVVRLEVQNDGSVVQADEIPRLFERFYRGPAGAAEDLTGTGTGTGLGLAVVRAIAQAHGGEATARRLPGGMCFEVVLPAARSEPSGLRFGRR